MSEPPNQRPPSPPPEFLAEAVPPQNPYASPQFTGPVIDTRSQSPLVRKLRRKTGDDLIYTAFVASMFGLCMPFGFVLDAVSLFLLFRVLITRSQPSVPATVIGILTAMWNCLRLFMSLAMFLAGFVASSS